MADLVFTALVLFWMFIGAVIVGGFSTIMLVMIVAWTPALAILKAKLGRMPLLAARRRDRKIHFVKADQYVQGLATSKEYGGFLIDSDSVFTEKKSGVAILPVNAEIGITLSEKVLTMIDGLKRAGIHNIEEAELLAGLYGKCECDYIGPGTPIEIKNAAGEAIGYDAECPIKLKGEEDDKAKEEERPLYVSGNDARKAQEKQEFEVRETGPADNGAGEDEQLQRPD